ncbi:MAG: GyrI-like domain-containing protein [Oscillospiraceae bacterium]|nr:GyrI-like domain-containing protein [Oscillospiraceae bacterium]
MKKERNKKRGRRWLTALGVIAIFAISVGIYGYIARQDPQRIVDNRIVKMERINYIDAPDLRLIGMAIPGNSSNELYDELNEMSCEFLPRLEEMDEYLYAEIADTVALWHNGNLDHEDPESMEIFIIGRLMSADAPVPDGFDYFDIPSAKIAKVYGKGEGEALQARGDGKFYTKVMKKHTIPYPEGWFFGELQLAETNLKAGEFSRMGFILPVVEH